MSFILDALRKSESERRREAVPDITHIPLAPARLGLPRWVAAVICALSVAVVAFALAWWHSARTPASDPAAAARTSEPAASAEPASRTATPRAAPERVSEPAASRTREIVPLAELAARPAGAASEAQSASPSERTAPQDSTSTPDGASTASASAAGRDASAADTEPVGALPRLADLRAEGVAVPELKLELHAYSETPASRFVFINGRRFGEGDALDSGPQVVRIAPEGAVLSHSGRRFALLPD